MVPDLHGFKEVNNFKKMKNRGSSAKKDGRTIKQLL